MTLGEKELRGMLDEQEAEGKKRELEVNCRFCTRKEVFTEADVERIIKESVKK